MSKKLFEYISAGNIYGFGKELKEKLKTRIDEMATASDCGDLEEDAVNMLIQAAKQFGADSEEIEYDEGELEVKFTCKDSLNDFTTYCDGVECVEGVEVELITSNATEDGEIDIDDIDHVDGNVYCVYVYLTPDIVVYGGDEEELTEVTRKIKINFRGKRRVKMQCRPGFKWDSAARTCRKITGTEKAVKRRALKKAVRTKKSMGNSFKLRVLRKTRKAKRFRKALGLG